MTAAWLDDLLRSIKEQRSVEFCRETLRKSGFSFTPAACSEYREELRHELSDLSVREKELKDELRALLRSYGMTDLQISWGIEPKLTKRQIKKADKIYDQLSTVWLEAMITGSFMEAADPNLENPPKNQSTEPAPDGK